MRDGCLNTCDKCCLMEKVELEVVTFFFILGRDDLSLHHISSKLKLAFAEDYCILALYFWWNISPSADTTWLFQTREL